MTRVAPYLAFALILALASVFARAPHHIATAVSAERVTQW